MDEHEDHSEFVNKVWQSYLTHGKVPPGPYHEWYESKFLRPFVRLLPSEPRCRICYYPFHGIGGLLARSLFGLVPSRMNPQLCNVCERFAERYQGGAEVELSMLFADVRGSTGIAEQMTPSDFSALIDRFYRVTTKILFRRNAFIEKLIGDEITGFFVPGFAGQDHARVAIEAGQEILSATGHGVEEGPWIPVGVGVHTGIAFVGGIGAEAGAADIALLGDNVNTAARIASQAGIGEVLASEAAIAAASLDLSTHESRHLELKGRTEPVDVRVIRVGKGPGPA